MSIATAIQPRIRFETVTGRESDALPRMDIAVFVGFAASGPMHIPVVIEDIDHFHRLYGETLFLARDAQTDTNLSANLGPTIVAFFANGGRRCWVIRVGSYHATYNYFKLPGIIKCKRGTDADILQQESAFARARSEGSWSDSINIRARLRIVSLPAKAFNFSDSIISILPATYIADKGSMVKLLFSGMGDEKYWLYAQAEERLTNNDPVVSQYDYQLINLNWYSDVSSDSLITYPVNVTVDSPIVKDEIRTKLFFNTDNPYAEPSVDTSFTSHNATLTRNSDGYRLNLLVSSPDSLPMLVDSAIKVNISGDVAWWITEKVFQQSNGQGQALIIELQGQLFWERNDLLTPASDVGQLQAAEVVSVDLKTLDEQGKIQQLPDIGLCPDHPRYWGDLLVDQGRYRPAPDRPLTKLNEEVRNTGFPLATADPRDLHEVTQTTFIPLGLNSEMSHSLAAVFQAAPSLERNGLNEYNSSLFVDPDLEEVSQRTLMQQADQIRYWGARPRPLLGMHAVLDISDLNVINEATLISIPDAVHRGWKKVDRGPAVSEVIPLDDAEIDAGEDGNNQFADCLQVSLLAPVLQRAKFGEHGHITLQWISQAATLFSLEESTSETFNTSTLLYTGESQAFSFNRAEGGTYYYRLRAVIGKHKSNWSNRISVYLPSVNNYQVIKISDYDQSMLKSVHHSLLNFCAAKGDMFSVLSLPQHFSTIDVQGYTNVLKSGFLRGMLPSALSYGAIYHPWIQCQDNRIGVITEPPEGVVLGVYAKRVLSRGAWVTPANEVYQTVLALDPPITDTVGSSVNVIINTPRGFLCWSANTLEDDSSDMSLINIRRLIILLRRLVLRYGAVYAFEPNGDELRRLIQRRFNALLRGLYEQGAFFGATPQLAYQVDTGKEFNSPQSIDQGRLIVAIRICPSHPMEFIVIKLSQTGEQLNVVEGV